MRYLNTKSNIFYLSLRYDNLFYPSYTALAGFRFSLPLLEGCENVVAYVICEWLCVLMLVMEMHGIRI